MTQLQRRSILYVIDAMPSGGGPKVCYDLIDRLDIDLFRPSVVTLFHKGVLGEKIEELGIPLLNLGMTGPFRFGTLLRYVPQISAFAREQQADMLHVHLLASGLYGAWAARAVQLPTLFTAHGALSKRFQLRVMEKIVRNHYRNLVAVSRGGADEIRRYMWRRGTNVECIYNGIDAEHWQCRDRAEKNKNVIRFVMVANFAREKDHMTLLKAYAQLVQAYPECQLALIGEGEGLPACREWVELQNLRGVEFIGDIHDVKPHLEQADIFVLSSHTEGISIAVLEAMSMELPVIASDVGAMKELVVDGKSGLLVAARNIEQMKNGMEKLLLNFELRKKLGQCARERVIENFSVQKMATKYQSLYLKIAGDQA